MVRVRAATLLASLSGALALTAHAEPIASSSPSLSAAGTPSQTTTWKQIYEDNQTVYYVRAADVVQTGESNAESLLEFKIPQVVGGAQAWSVVSHMKLNCDQKQVVTIGNTFYALRMGTGAVIQSQDVNDNWHQPEPGSLGELIWSTACGKN
ncbi:MAG TPA: surface-adhesin E family protein [Caulobacteraceae bacterium]|nr:surface-adhesin E family protein [Caulobacteraceae bacterium]